MITELFKLEEHLKAARYHLTEVDETLDLLLGFLTDLDDRDIDFNHN